jgi:tRNA pseudouridine55 synthase
VTTIAKADAVTVDGILNVAKPAGWTSHDVVAKLRRLLRERRIGHAGTLDPMATGVLIVCVGQATRVVDYLMGAPTQYRAVVQLGTTTTTDDLAGEITAQSDASRVSRADVEGLLLRFVGRIRQRPPVYSALKVEGRPLYRLARQGKAPEPEMRDVDVYGLSITDWTPPRFGLTVDCGRGTYVRSLARDIGDALGVGGCLAALERTRVGRYTLEDALTLDQIASLVEAGEAQSVLRPIDEALVGLEPVMVDDEGERRLCSGSTWLVTGGAPFAPLPSDGLAGSQRELTPVSEQPDTHGISACVRLGDSTSRPATRRRVYSIDGRLLAIADLDAATGVLSPVTTFRSLPVEPHQRPGIWE